MCYNGGELGNKTNSLANKKINKEEKMAKIAGFEKGLPFEDIKDVGTLGGPVSGAELVGNEGKTETALKRELTDAQKKTVGIQSLLAFQNRVVEGRLGGELAGVELEEAA